MADFSIPIRTAVVSFDKSDSDLGPEDDTMALRSQTLRDELYSV